MNWDSLIVAGALMLAVALTVWLIWMVTTVGT